MCCLHVVHTRNEDQDDAVRFTEQVEDELSCSDGVVLRTCVVEDVALEDLRSRGRENLMDAVRAGLVGDSVVVGDREEVAPVGVVSSGRHQDDALPVGRASPRRGRNRVQLEEHHQDGELSGFFMHFVHNETCNR